MAHHPDKTLFIDGRWRASGSGDLIDVFDSTNGEKLGHVSSATGDDVNDAVLAARRSFQAWADTPAEERALACERIATGMRDRADELADIITRETGMPRKLCLAVQVLVPADAFDRAANHARTFEYEQEIGNSIVVHEPVGVVAAITPWNYPLIQIAAKMAPALASGCTMILKPAQVAPLDSVVLAEIVDEAGLPDGVFNLITGTGRTAGEAMVDHPEVDMVSFTGSTSAGKLIASRAAGSIKRVSLELGGKSPNVILDDLGPEEFDKVVRDGVAKCYMNSGQTCTALTRMLVPRSMLEPAERIVTDEIESKYQPGEPFTKGVRLGPLASQDQVDTVTDYVNKGIAENARLVLGGPERPEGFDDGYYVKPTVFSEVSNDMTIAQEEIFGPVLSILPYDNEDEAVAIANGSPYGLAGAVWSSDQERAERVARRIRTGRIDINGGAFNPEAPFGGYKQSGYGRENGLFGFEEFLEVKSMQR